MGIVDAYNELFPVVGMNLLWLLFNVPLAVVGLVVVQIGTVTLGIDEDSRTAASLIFSLLLAVLLTLGPNPAAAGIYLWANRLVKEERVEFSLFWEGLRTYWRQALVLFLISAIGLLLLVVNALFYLRSESTPLRIFGIVWVYAIVVWMGMQIYQLPLLIEQDDKRIRLVLRNSLFLSMANVVPTLTLLIVCSVLTVLSLALTLLIALLTGSVIALITTRAVHLMLEPYRTAGGETPTPTA
jgi:uncharacterized membrane protein YesL